MKTHKVRPVLVETKEKSRICHLTAKGKEFNDLRYLEIEAPTILDSINYQLILISLEDEEIEVGNKYYDEHNNLVLTATTQSDHNVYHYKKVIATQEQLSPELIQQLVDEYNNEGMKDFKIEMEEITDEETIASSSGFSLKVPINIKYLPKLTNGFVTIIEKLQMPKISADDLPLANGGYTEEEVKELIIQALLEVDTLVTTCGQRDGWVELNNKEIDNWFNKNKKK